MINQKDVTLIIPTLSNERNDYALRECLTSLKESHFPLENIIVSFNNVMNSSFPESCIIDFEGVQFMALTAQGQCKAVNAAIAMVNTPWIMVSNDDMVFPHDWFQKLVHPIKDESSSKFCISPQLIEPRDGAPTFRKVFFGGIGGDWDKEGFLDYAEKDHISGGIRSGFNLPFLMKKETWDLVGGYDVNYDPWGSNSDSDLEYKLKLAGVQMLQNTDCPVYHFSNTSDTFVPINRPFWEKNWNYFIEKWGFPRTDDGIWQATFTIPSAEDGRKFQPSWEGFYERV